MLKSPLNLTACALVGLLVLGAGGLQGQEPQEFTLSSVASAGILTAPPHGDFLETLNLGDKVALMVTAGLTGKPGKFAVTSDDIILRYVANGGTKDVTCVAMPVPTPDFLTLGITDWSKTTEYKPAALYINFSLPPPREVRFIFVVPKTIEAPRLVQKGPGGADLVTKEIPAILDK